MPLRFHLTRKPSLRCDVRFRQGSLVAGVGLELRDPRTHQSDSVFVDQAPPDARHLPVLRKLHPADHEGVFR